MHFLDAWVELSALDLVRLVGPLALLAASAFFPGQRLGRVTALGVAVTIPLVRELGTSPALTVAWGLVWLLIALWRPRVPEETARKPLARPRGVTEAGTVGLALGVALTLLLVAAVARQDMSPEDTRRASFGVALLALGVLHLMLRRHIRRAMTGFATMGLGLQVLDAAAQGAQVQPARSGALAVLAATTLAVALALRVAISRERYAGTAWVSDAHDLHD